MTAREIEEAWEQYELAHDELDRADTDATVFAAIDALDARQAQVERAILRYHPAAAAVVSAAYRAEGFVADPTRRSALSVALDQFEEASGDR